MEEKISVSVIVPMFNAERYIERCATSLLNQTLSTIELVFIDDCSADRTVSVLKNTIEKFPNSKCTVKIIELPTNQGPSCARNRGIDEASGEYIIYCDSDDWVDLDMCEKLYEKAVADNLDLLWCDFIMHFSDHQTYVKAIDEQVDKISTLKSYISYGWNICVNLLVKRNLYVNANLRWCESVRFNEDYDISVRIFYFANQLAKLNNAFYHYDRTNEESLIRCELDERKKWITASSELHVCNRINDFFHEKGLLNDLEKELSWRMLKAKRYLLYDLSKREDYLSIFPESNKHISSNPLCRKIDQLSQKLIIHRWSAWLLPMIKVIDSVYKQLYYAD